MWYFRAKDDLRFLHALSDVTNQYLATDHRLQWFKEKGQYHYRDHRGNMNEEGSDLHKKLQADWYEHREAYTKKINRAIALFNRLGVQRVVPLPIGNEILPVDIFQNVIATGKRPFKSQRVIDRINEAIGAAEDQVRREFRWLINPLYWIYAMFRATLGATGADKVMTDTASSLVAKGLTALFVAVTPWLVQFMLFWIKVLFGMSD